jgi:hypothetical protein
VSLAWLLNALLALALGLASLMRAILSLPSRIPRPRPLGILAAAVCIVVAVAAFYYYALMQREQAPEQPIAFPHTWHAQSVRLDCLFCHRGASTKAAAGVLPVQGCMFCHQVAGHQSPQVQKLIMAYESKQPIDWVRVYRLPDHVRFQHGPHTQAGVGCVTCHGDISSVTVTTLAVRLRMGDCVNCHRQQSAPTDCLICHY